MSCEIAAKNYPVSLSSSSSNHCSSPITATSIVRLIDHRGGQNLFKFTLSTSCFFSLLLIFMNYFRTRRRSKRKDELAKDRQFSSTTTTTTTTFFNVTSALPQNQKQQLQQQEQINSDFTYQYFRRWKPPPQFVLLILSEFLLLMLFLLIPTTCSEFLFFTSTATATFLDTNHESTQQYYHNYHYNTLSPSIGGNAQAPHIAGSASASSNNINNNNAGGRDHTIYPSFYGSTVNGVDESANGGVAMMIPSDFTRDAEYRLIRDLLSGKLHGLSNGYDRNVRPTRYMDMKLNISFGVLLSQVMDLDEKNQILTTSCWLNENWLDAYLSWNPLHYGNVTVIRLPASTIWKPDILLYNNADATYYRNTIATNAIVDNSGNVSLLTTSIYKSACRIDVQYFPFDQQVCNLSFGSWTFETRQLDLTLPTTEGDLSQYMENTEWNLTSMKAIREEVIFSCCPNDPYTFVHIEITMRRRPLFYVFNLILPCILITGLALLGFYTPSESGEKVTLGITTLLSLTVFLMFVGESMPPTSDTLPLIGVYYGVTIIVVSIATSLTVLTLNMHHCGNHGRVVPRWLSTAVLGYLAPALLIRVDWSENLPQAPFFSFNPKNQPKFFSASSYPPDEEEENFNHQQATTNYGATNTSTQQKHSSICFECCRGGQKKRQTNYSRRRSASGGGGGNNKLVLQSRLDNGMLKNAQHSQQQFISSAIDLQQRHGTFSSAQTTTSALLAAAAAAATTAPPLLPAHLHRPHCHHQQHAAYNDDNMNDDDEENDENQTGLLPDALDVVVCGDVSSATSLRHRRGSAGGARGAHLYQNVDHPTINSGSGMAATNQVLRTLAYNEARYMLQERLDTIKTEWQLVAKVIDRFLLIIFVISTFAVSSYILLRSPYMWN